MAVIDSLVAQLSFDFDGKKLDTFNEGMLEAGKNLAKLYAGAATAGAAIFAFTAKVAGSNDEMGKTAQVIGITAQSLNELGFVAELNGGSLNSMGTALESIAKISSEASRGIGSGVETFGLLGVSVTNASGELKKADEIMLDVSDSLARLDSQSKKIEMLDKLGIDSQLLLTLEQGASAIRKQREEVVALGFVLDKDATQSAAKFNDEMLRVGTVVKGVASAVGTKLMKQITPMLGVFLKWFKANKEIIKQNITEFFLKITKVIRSLFNIASRVVSVVNTLANAFGGWEKVLIAVGVAVTALNIKILLIPALIVAAFAAIFLVVEDVITYINDGDSAIGALIGRFPALQTAINAVKGAFTDTAKTFPLMTKGINGFKKVFDNITTDMSDAWDFWSDGELVLSNMETLLKKLGKLPVFEQLFAIVGGLKDAGDFLSGKGDSGTKSNQSPTFIGQVQAPQANNTNNTNNSKVTVNVNGGNLEEVKRVVTEVIDGQYKAAEKNVSTNIIS